MPKTHPSDTAKIVYRIKSPEVWKAIRAEWEAGGRPATLSRRFDVSDSSISARASREGWTRDTGIQSLLNCRAADITAQAIADAALTRALEALAQGRAGDALALIKAGDAVGAFADFAHRLRNAAGVATASAASESSGAGDASGAGGCEGGAQGSSA